MRGKMHAGRCVPPIGPYTHWLAEQGLNQRFRDDYEQRAANGHLWRAAHDSILPAHAFEDTYIGQRAVKWLREIPDDFPWHYFVSFVGPHNPFDPPTEFAEHFRHAAMPEAINPTGEGKPPLKKQDGLASANDILLCRRQYCAAIEAIDVQVGEILQTLESRGQRDNTFLIFASDHGEMLGDHGRWTKEVFYESALRVPLVVAGPGIEAGRRIEALVELIDLNPTICDLAGAPTLENTDAMSILPLLSGKADKIHDDAVSSLRGGRCIRTLDWKLIQHFGGGVELYDLGRDPDELRNVASENPSVVRDLAGRLTSRFLEGGCAR